MDSNWLKLCRRAAFSGGKFFIMNAAADENLVPFLVQFHVTFR